MNRPLLILGALCLALGLIFRPDLRGHGLTADHGSGVSRLERVVLVTANDHLVDPGDPHSVTWSGFFYQPWDTEVLFRTPEDVNLRLMLDGKVVFDRSAQSSLAEGAARVRLSKGLHALRLEVDTGPAAGAFFQAGLEWWTPFGWRLVPAAYLYPVALEARQAERDAWGYQASYLLFGLAVVSGIALAAHQLWEHRRSLLTRTALLLGLLVLFALGIRLAVLQDLISVPNSELLGLGLDQRAYQGDALDMLRGAWPRGAFYQQPGLVFVMGAIYQWLGPGAWKVQVIQMIGGALASVLVFDTARRLFGPASGWAAALLWAAFPNAIFYEAQLLTHGLEPQVAALFMWAWTRTMETGRRRWVAALGLSLGLSAVLRPTFLLLAPFMAAGLVWKPPFAGRGAVFRLLMLGSAAILPILPVALHNQWSGGGQTAISGNGAVNFYMGNNRDASGLGGYSIAFKSAAMLIEAGETEFWNESLQDIRADPTRWARLIVRKAALALADRELPDNVDLYREGLKVSSALSFLPIRFGLVMVLAATGVFLAFRRRERLRPGFWIPLAVLVTQLMVLVVFHASSRYRAPVYPALAIFGGRALADLVAQVARVNWKGLMQWGGVGLVSAGFIASMPYVAGHVLQPPVVAGVPPTARTTQLLLGTDLELVGYEPLPEEKPGWPLIVTVYWRSRGSIPVDYQASIQLAANAGGSSVLARSDQAIGTGTFPLYPTSFWKPGEIVRDQYLLEIPKGLPSGATLSVFLSVYSSEEPLIGEISLGPLPSPAPGQFPSMTDANEVGASVGNARLLAWRSAMEGGALAVTLYWQAAGPTAEDGVVFVHMLDKSGQAVAGHDGRPMGGTYWTGTWQVGEIVQDTHRLQLPDGLPAAEYVIAAGMYDSKSLLRLPVLDAGGHSVEHNVIELGRVELDEQKP